MAPGARSKFGAPMLESEVFRKQMHCIEESTCDIVGTFQRDPQWFGALTVTQHPRNCAPLATLRYAPGHDVNCVMRHLHRISVAYDQSSRKVQTSFFLLGASSPSFERVVTVHCLATRSRDRSSLSAQLSAQLRNTIRPFAQWISF